MLLLAEINHSFKMKWGCVKILTRPLVLICCKTYNKASTFPSGGFVMSKSFSNFVTIK